MFYDQGPKREQIKAKYRHHLILIENGVLHGEHCTWDLMCSNALAQPEQCVFV